MEKIKLKDFVELSNGSCYCIVNQKEIAGQHFALALTVPDKIDEMKNAEIRLLKVSVHEKGQLKIREYTETEKDYHKIMDILVPHPKAIVDGAE